MSDKPKFSWNQLVVFANAAQRYMDGKNGSETKFTYALRRVLPQIGALNDKVETALAGIEIDNCVTEKRNGTDGVIVKDDQGSLMFTPASMKLCRTQKQDHLAGQNYEIDPYFARGELPTDLTVDQVMAFAGLVIQPEQVDAILSKLEDEAPDCASVNGHKAAAAASQ